MADRPHLSPGSAPGRPFGPMAALAPLRRSAQVGAAGPPRFHPQDGIVRPGGKALPSTRNPRPGSVCRSAVAYRIVAGGAEPRRSPAVLARTLVRDAV